MNAASNSSKSQLSQGGIESLTIYGHLMNANGARNYYVIASRETSVTQPTDKSGYLSCSRRVVSTFWAILNVVIEMQQRRHKKSSIIKSFSNTELSHDIPNRKWRYLVERTWIVAIHFPGDSFDVIEARLGPQVSETTFSVKTATFPLRVSQTTPGYHWTLFVATILTYGRLVVRFVAAMMVSNHFRHYETWRGKLMLVSTCGGFEPLNFYSVVFFKTSLFKVKLHHSLQKLNYYPALYFVLHSL